VANSLAGVRGGARQIECTINGIGERAGNAALEEIVMAIRTRGDALPYETGIDATMLTRASKLVSAVTSFPVQYNKAIVGKNAFAHESGIHQDGMLKNAADLRDHDAGERRRVKTSLVMGKHSGRHAFKEKLKELGYDLGDNALQDAFKRFKDLADRKKHVYDEDIEALVDDEIAHQHDRIKVVALTVIAGTMGPQSATLTLDIDGVHKTVQATGNGPVDAIFNAIKALVPHEAKLELYQVHAGHRGHGRAGGSVGAAVGSGWRTAACVSSPANRGADPDTLVASAEGLCGAARRTSSGLLLRPERLPRDLGFRHRLCRGLSARHGRGCAGAGDRRTGDDGPCGGARLL
jgi:2-isopropylmalate synthase